MSTQIPPVATPNKNHFPAQILTSPIGVASATTRLLSHIASSSLLTPAATTFYVTVSAINGLFKLLVTVSAIAERAEASTALTGAVKEINEELIDANMRIRESRQEIMNRVAQGAQILNYIPVVGSILSGTINVAATIASAEAKGEKVVSWWAKQYIRTTFDFLRYSSPKLLRGAHILFSHAEDASSWVKQKLCKTEQIAEQLTNFADRADAMRWKLIHANDPPTKKESTGLTVQSFKDESVSARDDMFFLLEHASSVNLTREQLGNFIYALKQLQHGESNQGIDAVLQEFVVLYNKLTLAEKRKITPSDVASMDCFEKFKALQLLNISTFTTPFEIEALPKEKKERVDKLIVTGFLQGASNWLIFSKEELTCLPDCEQFLLLELASAKVAEKGTAAEKVRLVQLRKNAGPLNEQELELVATFLNRHLTGAEKVALGNSLKAKSAKIHPQQISYLVEQLEKAHKQTNILALKEQIEALNMQPQENNIAYLLTHVGQKTARLSYLQRALYSCLNGLGTVTSAVFEKIDSSTFLEKVLNKSATAIELLMILPQGKQLVASLLYRSGVPIYQIEAFLAKLALQVAKMPLQVAHELLSLRENKTIEVIGKKAHAHGKSQATSWVNWLVSPSKSVQDYLKNWTQQAGSFTEANAKKIAAEKTKYSLLELSSLWDMLLKRKTHTDGFSRFVHKLYTDAIGPSIATGLDAADSLCKISLANYALLETSMDVGLQADLQAKQFLEDKAKFAANQAQNSSQPWLQQKFYESISWSLPALNWLFLGSQSLVVLPFIMKRVVPHVLRSLADKTSPSFWQQLAVHSKDKLQNAAKFVQKKIENGASSLASTHYIDQSRIDAFKKLSKHEKMQLFAHAEIHPKDDDDTVRVLEKLDAMENDPHSIPISLTEFFALTLDAQQDILFTVAHSIRYKHFRDTDSANIVKKYLNLPTKIQKIYCPNESVYKKLPIQDQESVRLLIAKNLQLLDGIVYPTLEESISWQQALYVPQIAGWEYKEFKSLDRLSNNRLRNILTLYAALTPAEREILTPSRCKKMTPIKINQLLKIIDKYHPELLDTKFTIHKKLKGEKLSALASIYTQLPAGQKAKLLQMEPLEIEQMPLNLLNFLLAETKESEKIQNELIKLAKNETVDAALIAKIFNRLTRIQQANWYERSELEAIQHERVNQLIMRECEALKAKIQAVGKRIIKKSDTEYLVLSHKITTSQKDLDLTISDISSKKAIIFSLESALKAIATRTHDQKVAKLQTLKLEVTELETKCSKISKTLNELREKQENVTREIINLQELQHGWKEKLIALQTILGVKQEIPSVIDESPATKETIDAIITATVNECCQTTKQALIQNIQKHISNPVHFDRQVAFSRELIDELISCRHEHLKVIQEKITHLKQSLVTEKDPEKAIQLQLQARTLHNFNLRLHSALLQQFQQLSVQFEEQLQVMMLEQQQDLIAATNKLRALAHKPLV